MHWSLLHLISKEYDVPNYLVSVNRILEEACNLYLLHSRKPLGILNILIMSCLNLGKCN